MPRSKQTHLSFGPRGPEHELEVVERTLDLLVEFDGAVLGQGVRLVTVGAVKTTRFGLHELHEPTTLSTPTGKEGISNLD